MDQELSTDLVEPRMQPLPAEVFEKELCSDCEGIEQD